jgi:phage terminase large subunit GpA-like protein
MTTLADVRRRALSALIPPPRLKLSAWVEANIHLPAGVSATPGPMRLIPYPRAICDSIGDPAVERVTVLKSVRIGYTSLLMAAIGAYAANEPAPILLLMPTEADARDIVVSDIEPLFDASPTLKGILAGELSTGQDRSTLMHRRFPGGSLKIVAARAPRNLRRHNARILMMDEIDGFDVTAEGVSGCHALPSIHALAAVAGPQRATNFATDPLS